MSALYFANPISLLTIAAVLAVLAFIAVALVRRKDVRHWGRLVLVLVLAGTAISGLSATRDAYMTADALFAVESLQSTLCSVAGGLIFLAGLVTIFVRRQSFRKFSFFFISMLFVAQVLTVEASRIVLL